MAVYVTVLPINMQNIMDPNYETFQYICCNTICHVIVQMIRRL
jgi:hypothetical protein